MPDLVRLLEHSGGIPPAAPSRSAPHTSVVPQQRRSHILRPLEISGKDASPMADIGFDLQEIIGIAVEHTGMKPHYLHRTDRPSITDRLRLQAGVLREQDASQQAGRQLQLPGFLHNGAGGAVGDFWLGRATEYLGQG